MVCFVLPFMVIVKYLVFIIFFSGRKIFIYLACFISCIFMHVKISDPARLCLHFTILSLKLFMVCMVNNNGIWSEKYINFEPFVSLYSLYFKQVMS